MLPTYSRNRSELRFGLRLPVQISAENAVDGAIIAFSENISAHGILLRVTKPIPKETWLRLAIVVKPATATKPTRLVAAGRVLRAERGASNDFLIAICCTRPFRMLGASGDDT
jgi:hypothetical protein